MVFAFVNRDNDVTHNFAMFQHASDTTHIAATDIRSGPSTEALPLTMEPGMYQFHFRYIPCRCRAR